MTPGAWCGIGCAAAWLLAALVLPLLARAERHRARRQVRDYDARTTPGVPVAELEAYLDRRKAEEDAIRSAEADRLIEETRHYYPLGSE